MLKRTFASRTDWLMTRVTDVPLAFRTPFCRAHGLVANAPSPFTNLRTCSRLESLRHLPPLSHTPTNTTTQNQ